MGLGLGRVLVLVCTGVGGSVLISSGCLRGFISDLEEFMREKGDGGFGESVTKQLQRQVDALSKEVWSISPATVIHVNSGGKVLSALVVPAAAAGVLGYGYMRWKGIPISSLMYVTKQNMANAVSSMTKHLEQVQNSLGAAKRYLTQRIQRVDDKVDQQKQISGQIRDEVTGARLKLEDIGLEMKNLKMLACNLDGKLNTIQSKQDCQLAGVSYLLQFIEPNDPRMELPGRQAHGKFIQHVGADRLEGVHPLAAVTSSGKQEDFMGKQFGLRLLALQESANSAAGLLRST